MVRRDEPIGGLRRELVRNDTCDNQKYKQTGNDTDVRCISSGEGSDNERGNN